MRRSVVPGLLALLLLLTACSSRASADDPVRQPGQVATTAPTAALTVVADKTPAAAAISTSRALFGASDAVVVAREGDPAGTLLGASAAVALGVPLLVQPSGAPDGTVSAELDRLHVTAVLAVGPVDAAALGQGARPGSRTVVAVPAEVRAVAVAANVRLGKATPVPDGARVAAVAALGGAQPAALVPAGVAAAPQPASSSAPSSEPATLPRIERGHPLDATMVLTTGGEETLAGVATARAAGAHVQLTAGATDPRASTEVVTALARQHPRVVLALGAGFAGEKGLDWKLATAATGTQLPGGGQLLFPGRTLVALYGTPGTAALGVLGEQDLPASIERARQHAAAYRPLLDGPIVPTFEIIATVASGAPGPDGDYSTEIDPASLRPWVEAAGKAGMYVVLDLQPGRADFLSQAKRYQSLLEEPNVGLALDAEWRLAPGQLPLQQIGSASIEEINSVVTWLADLTRSRLLPQKLFVLHQFRLSMIRDRDRLDTSRDELAMMIHADGQGAQPTKQGTWQVLHQDLPPGPLWWGWKNFYDEDHPMLTPEQTVAQVHPTPNLISYQ